MPDRLTLSREKGYRKPPEAINVTRATVFGNPWCARGPGVFCVPQPDRVGWVEWIVFHHTLDTVTVVRFYRDWLRTDYVSLPRGLSHAREDALRDHMAARRALILSRLPDLRGGDLCCHCPPGSPCHADVLMEMANE